MPFHHVLVKVPAAEHAAVVDFYTKALKPIGSSLLMSLPNGFTGYGGQKPEYFITKTDTTLPSATHVAFVAPDRDAVDAFHAAALEAGGKDNGAPGYRTHIRPDYYAAFVLDPVGNNIEVVCISPQGGNI